MKDRRTIRRSDVFPVLATPASGTLWNQDAWWAPVPVRGKLPLAVYGVGRPGAEE